MRKNLKIIFIFYKFFLFLVILQGVQTAMMADSDARASNPSKTFPQHIAALAGKMLNISTSCYN